MEAKSNMLLGPSSLVNDFRSNRVNKTLYPYLKTHEQLCRIVKDARAGMKVRDPIDANQIDFQAYEVN
jgi:hypothetical protein